MPSSLSEWRQPGRWTIFPVAWFAKSHDAVSLLADRPAIERSEDFLGKTNKVRPLTWLDTSIGGIVSRKISLVFPSFAEPGEKKNLLIHSLQRICPHLDRKAGHGNGYPGRKAKQ
jgi:hypothetical protein